MDIKSLKLESLKKNIAFLLSFFTSKKFFVQRLAILLGIIIQIIDTYIRKDYSRQYRGEDITLIIIACFIFGTIIQVPLMWLADIFCKEKTYSNIVKFNNDRYTTNDVCYVTDILEKNNKIDKDTNEIIKYLLNNQPQYTPETAKGDNYTANENVKKEYLTNVKQFIDTVAR